MRRLYAHSVPKELFPSSGEMHDYIGLPVQRLEDDERLITLCSLYLLGQQAPRIIHGTNSNIFWPDSQIAREEISIIKALPVVQILQLQQQLVPHDVIKVMFERDLLPLMLRFRGGESSSGSSSSTLNAEQLKCLQPSFTLLVDSPSSATRLMHASAIVALERGKYELCASVLSLLTGEHMDTLGSFVAVERGQHFLTRLAGNMLLAHQRQPVTTGLLEALTMFIQRLVYLLHKTYENDNRGKTKSQWRMLAQEIHFVAIWIIKKLPMVNNFDLKRIYEICITIIAPLLPNKEIPDHTSMSGSLSYHPGSGSSLLGFMPNTPDDSLMGGTTPHPVSSSSASSSSASSSTSVVDTTAGLKQWWASRDFNTVRRAYTSLAMRAHIKKGGSEHDPIDDHMQQLLTAMHVNPRDGLNSGKASPGFPSSTNQFGSPLASPANMTPQYGNAMSVPPSASPMVGSQDSSPASASDLSASPKSSTNGSPVEHPAPSLENRDGQPPIKRSRLE